MTAGADLRDPRGAVAVAAKADSPLKRILTAPYRRRTIVNAALLTVAIIGLWAGAVYEPTAVITLAKRQGIGAADAVRVLSWSDC